MSALQPRASWFVRFLKFHVLVFFIRPYLGDISQFNMDFRKSGVDPSGRLDAVTDENGRELRIDPAELYLLPMRLKCIAVALIRPIY